jgi:hypothetical protein
MALGIDTKHMVEKWIPDHENHLDDALGTSGRLQMHRVYAHAMVIHDPAMMRRLSEARGRPFSRRKQAVLDWQPDEEDEQSEWEVFRHLHELYETASERSGGFRALVTSAESPSFAARAQGRSPSSFRRYSIKISMLRNDRNEAYGMYLITHTDLQKLFPNARHRSWCKWGYEPKILCSNARHRCAVFWQMQIDFVDLLSRKTQAAPRLGKRRRTMDPFLRVESSSQGRVPVREKRFKGVRHRPERKAWVAEMKPPGSRNKVSFGDFRSDTEAARAVDAAFHYYGKTEDVLNFADSAHILATRAAPGALDEEEKLRFVKEQAKWLAAMASTLPPSRTSAFAAARATSGIVSISVPESSGGCTGDALGFRSFSEIASSLSCGGCGDGGFQPQPWVQPHAMVANFAAVGFSEGQWSVENAIADPFDDAMSQRAELPAVAPSCVGWSTSASSVHITEPWDSPECSSAFFTPSGSAFEVDRSCEFQVDPPFLPTMFLDRLMLEQHTFGYE